MAVSVLTTPTSTSTTAPANPYTSFTHTCTAGSDRLLLLFIGVGDGASSRLTDAAPTYGGQTMTRIGSGADDGVWVGVDVWYLKETGIAAASSATFSIDTQAAGNVWGDQLGVGAVCLAGVDQTTPIDTGSVQTNIAGGTSASVTVTGAAGNLIVAALMSDNEGGVTENRTALFETAVIDSDTIAAAQYTTLDGSIAMTWTQGSNGFAVIGFEVNAAAGGGGASVVPILMNHFRQRRA